MTSLGAQTTQLRRAFAQSRESVDLGLPSNTFRKLIQVALANSPGLAAITLYRGQPKQALEADRIILDLGLTFNLIATIFECLRATHPEKFREHRREYHLFKAFTKACGFYAFTLVAAGRVSSQIHHWATGEKNLFFPDPVFWGMNILLGLAGTYYGYVTYQSLSNAHRIMPLSRSKHFLQIVSDFATVESGWFSATTLLNASPALATQIPLQITGFVCSSFAAICSYFVGKSQDLDTRAKKELVVDAVRVIAYFLTESVLIQEITEHYGANEVTILQGVLWSAFTAFIVATSFGCNTEYAVQDDEEDAENPDAYHFLPADFEAEAPTPWTVVPVTGDRPKVGNNRHLLLAAPAATAPGVALNGTTDLPLQLSQGIN